MRDSPSTSLNANKKEKVNQARFPAHLNSSANSMSGRTHGIVSVHDRRFMSEARRTRYFARSATRARSPSCRASCSCRAPREISRSPRFAHRAPVMQAMASWDVRALV